MFCLNCAADLPDAAEFCHNCGMMVATEPAGAPPEELGPEPAATVTPAAKCRQCGRQITEQEAARTFKPGLCFACYEGPGSPHPRDHRIESRRVEAGAAEARRAAAQRPPLPPLAVVNPPSSYPKYIGAAFVAGSLLVIGWGILLLGLVSGFAAANQCRDVLGEKCNAGTRIGVFLGIVLVSWFVATGLLWAAYALRLLSDIEIHARSDQGTNRTDRPRS